MLKFLVPALAASLCGVAAMQDTETKHKNLSYGPLDRQKLDLTVPPSAAPVPLVIWVHGGGWEAGSKDGPNPATLLVKQGYAVASVNYRLSQSAVFPAQFHDCQAAVRFLRANAAKYNLDPAHFGAYGASAGGHLVALLGTADGVKELDGDATSKVSARVQAVCDWFGPTDLVKLSPPQGKDNPITHLLGGDTGEKADLARLANPITHVTADDAPVLTFHGTADTLVPLEQSELLDKALKKAGVPSELVVIAGGGHGDPKFIAGLRADANKDKTRQFFDKHLKPAAK